MKFKIFETDRLIIRPTSIEDATFLLILMNSKSWIQHIGDRKIRTIAQAEEYIKRKVFPQLEKLGYSNYTIVKKDNKQKVGTCGLYNREGLEEIDIGFALLPEYEKLGFAYEAANRIKNAAFYEFGLTELSAITNKENKSSQNLLKKLGLEKIGIKKLPKSDEELLLYRVKK